MALADDKWLLNRRELTPEEVHRSCVVAPGCLDKAHLQGKN